MRWTVMNEFVSTKFKCELLAEFDEVTVTDRYGNTYKALSTSTSETPDGDPILSVQTDNGPGYIFVETIQSIEGTEA